MPKRLEPALDVFDDLPLGQDFPHIRNPRTKRSVGKLSQQPGPEHAREVAVEWSAPRGAPKLSYRLSPRKPEVLQSPDSQSGASIGGWASDPGRACQCASDRRGRCRNDASAVAASP